MPVLYSAASDTFEEAKRRRHGKEMLEVLIAAREKLTVYRSLSTGEYAGGMEYTELMRRIDAVLANAKGQG